MKSRHLLASLAAALNLPFALPTLAADSQAVLKAASASVVAVEAQDDKKKVVSQGSGVVIAENEIVTHCRLAVDGDHLVVRDSAGEHPATWTLRHMGSNLCLLTADNLTATPAKPGLALRLLPSDPVYALAPTTTPSLVTIPLAGPTDLEDKQPRLQTAASPGAIGGGLFDGNGRLVAIVGSERNSQGHTLSPGIEAVTELKARGKAVAAILPPANPEPDWPSAFQTAHEQRNWAELEALARRHLYLYPNNDYGLIQLSEALMNIKHPGTAAPLLEQVLRQHPDHPDALGLLSAVRLAQDNPAAGETLARRLVERWPGNGFAHASLGKVLAAGQQWSAAVGHYRRAVELTPGRADFWAALGEVETRLDQFESAARAYRTALKLQPDQATAKAKLPLVLAKLDRWDEIRALQVEPKVDTPPPAEVKPQTEAKPETEAKAPAP